METTQLVEENNLAIKATKDPIGLKTIRPNSFGAHEGIKTSGAISKPGSFGARERNRPNESFSTKMVTW